MRTRRLEGLTGRFYLLLVPKMIVAAAPLVTTALRSPKAQA
jgi:hypothetical protein